MRLERRNPDEVRRLVRTAVDAKTLAAAAKIVDAVRREGEEAVRRTAEKHDGLTSGERLVFDRPSLQRALGAVSKGDHELLLRVSERIASFARAQLDSLTEMTVAVEGGRAGQWIAAVDRAGCYAPGGRFPLPSTVLMTAVTARTAGVESVVVASPRPGPLMLAAAAVADADAVLAVGGAQAVAALAYGFEGFEGCDVVVGPGNRWVTAAKQLVSGTVGIDMLAGPSELVVLADDGADPTIVAADLLAQAEHDPDALPVLVTPSPTLAARVDHEIERQLDDLSTRDVAVARSGVTQEKPFSRALAAT
ncbi:MAG: histidinol dehydrogenase, partial [Acidobacteriota bacterium]